MSISKALRVMSSGGSSCYSSSSSSSSSGGGGGGGGGRRRRKRRRKKRRRRGINLKWPDHGHEEGLLHGPITTTTTHWGEVFLLCDILLLLDDTRTDLGHIEPFKC